MNALRHARKNLETMTVAELERYAAGRRKAAQAAINSNEFGRALGFIDAAKKAERRVRELT